MKKAELICRSGEQLTHWSYPEIEHFPLKKAMKASIFGLRKKSDLLRNECDVYCELYTLSPRQLTLTLTKWSKIRYNDTCITIWEYHVTQVISILSRYSSSILSLCLSHYITSRYWSLDSILSSHSTILKWYLSHDVLSQYFSQVMILSRYSSHNTMLSPHLSHNSILSRYLNQDTVLSPYCDTLSITIS